MKSKTKDTSNFFLFMLLVVALVGAVVLHLAKFGADKPVSAAQLLQEVQGVSDDGGARELLMLENQARGL